MGGLDFLITYVCYGCDAHGWSCVHGGSCFLLLFILFLFFCCMPILACRLLGASLAFSGYRGAPIAAWVWPLSKPYVSTDLKKQEKTKKKI